MAITHLGAKRIQGTKVDRVVDSLGSSADGANTGITLATTTPAYEQSSGAEAQDLNSGAKGMGQYIRSTSSKLYGKTITNIQFYLRKDSPQSGSVVRARHYDEDDNLVHQYWTKDATTLPTSLAWTDETTASGDTAYEDGDYFVIEYCESDGTTASGAVKTNRKASGSGTQWDGSYSGFINTYFGSASYKDTGNRDMWFKINISDPSNVKFGTGAYSFDGNDYVEVNGLKTIFNGATKLSVAGWIYPRDNVDETLLGQWNGSGDSDKVLDLHINGSNKLELSLRNGSTNYITVGTTSINENEWQHVAMTYDGATTTVKLYVNGIEDVEDTSNPSSLHTGTGSPALFGIYGDKSSNGFDGIVGDWGCWSRVLTATEITALVNEQGYGGGLGSTSNGTNSGATYQTSVKKFGSGSFRFVASDPDWVDLGNNFTSFQTGDISWSFWFRVDSTSGTQGLLSKDFTSHTAPYYTFSNRTEGSDSTDYIMNCAGNDAGAYDGDENRSANGSISANTWHNWIVTQSVSGSGTQNAYLDGTLVSSSPITKKPTFYSTNWFLGRMGNFSNGSNALTGYMQDVCFWNKVIPASTISALQTTQVKSLSDKSGIKAYYPLDVAPVSNVVINEAILTDEKTTLTNVPTNSRYEETDTRKIFRNTILKDNCIAYYNFDSTSGGLVNQATTTNGFASGLGSSADGTVSGATLDTTNEKLGTGCYDFDGTDDYVNLGTNSGLNLLSGGTICMWINYDDMTNKRWAGKGTNGAWEILCEGGSTDNKIKFRVNDGSVKNAIGTTVLNSSTWYHVGAVYDKSAGEIKLYINGSLETTTSSIGQIATISTATYFGRNEGGNYVNGRIDDTGIWNVALSADQISALYNSGTGKTVNTANVWKERGTA